MESMLLPKDGMAYRDVLNPRPTVIRDAIARLLVSIFRVTPFKNADFRKTMDRLKGAVNGHFAGPSIMLNQLYFLMLGPDLIKPGFLSIFRGFPIGHNHHCAF